MKLDIVGMYRRGLSASQRAGYSTQGLQAYKYLKSFIDRNVTRSTLKEEWKFTIDNTQFQFTPGKQ